MSIFNKKTKELNFLREQNRKLIERIGERNKTIRLYEDEIIKRGKQIYELESYIESRKPKRSQDGKFASKNNSNNHPLMTIICDGKKSEVHTVGDSKFTKDFILTKVRSCCRKDFKSFKIIVRNNG